MVILFVFFFEGMKAQFGMIWLMEKVYMLLKKGLSGLFLPFLIRFMLVIFIATSLGKNLGSVS